MEQAGAELCQAQTSSSLLYQVYKLKLGGAIQKSTFLVCWAAGRAGRLENFEVDLSFIFKNSCLNFPFNSFGNKI